MTLVKICGINDVAAYNAAQDADYLAFNFFSRSPRHVTAAQAALLAKPGGPAKVGLFVSPTEAEIAAALAAVRLDVLQIYADAGVCRTLRARFGIKLWRAVGVTSAADLPLDDEGLDGFVIEAKPPPGATRPGGNAAALDWAMLAGWQAPAPWLLAGGLTPENVTDAIAASHAPGVDVSSGVEDAPGRKSPALIQGFIASARRP
jgi:phosphoribosylanthranilate isomerase